MTNELDSLKYEIYKKSGKKDYITFKQFKNNEDVAYTFGELSKREKKRKSEKRMKKDLKNTKK